MPNASQPTNILFLALSGIGNFIMQSPVFTAAKRAWPDAKITCWVAPRGTKALAVAHPAIDQVIEAPIRKSPLLHIKHALELARHKFDVGLVLYPGQHWKSAGYMWLAGINQRIGHAYPFRGDRNSAFLLTHSVAVDQALHDVKQNLNLLRPLGVNANDLMISNYELLVPKENILKSQKLMADLHLTPGKSKIVGFHLGSAPDMPFKRWPINRFIELGKRLVANDAVQIALFGGPDENDLKQAVKIALGDRATNVSADLLTTAGVISSCDMFVSNDSGLMHIAAATGIPTFGLFGPTSEQRTGPRGQDSHVIRANGTTASFDVNTNFDLGNTAHATMLAITVKQVFDQIHNKMPY